MSFVERYLPSTGPRLILAASVPVALSSGTLFVYSVYGTQLADQCGLDSSLAANLNISATVGTSIGGLLGGYITDLLGTQIPVFCSLVFISFGYKWLHSLYNQGDNAQSWQLIAAMFFIGLGSTSSYFASLKAVTVSFPKYKATAQSITIASFAISSLLYSLVYTKVFHGDVSRFLFFLAASSTVMQLIGVIYIRIAGHKNLVPNQDFFEEGQQLLEESESDSALDVPDENKHQVGSLKHLNLRSSIIHPIFLVHFFLMAILQGLGQMYIYSVGFIVKAIYYGFLHSSSNSNNVPSLHSLQALHVSLIAIFSFLGRLTSGPLSDNMVHRFKCQRHWVTVLGVLIMLLGHFLLSFPIDAWSSNLTHVNVCLSLISCIIGFAYGLCFTTFPGIMADLFSMKNYSLIWGIVYSSTVPGLTVFTKIFGYIYDHNSVLVGDDYVCDKGSFCYLATFELTSCLTVIVLVVLLVYIYLRRS